MFGWGVVECFWYVGVDFIGGFFWGMYVVFWVGVWFGFVFGGVRFVGIIGFWVVVVGFVY